MQNRRTASTRSSMNYKNLNYEIETSVDRAPGSLIETGRLLPMNYKNLNYEIETIQYFELR